MRKRHSRRDARHHRAGHRAPHRAHGRARPAHQRIAAWFAADNAAAPVTWRYLPHLLIAAFLARAAVALSGDFVLHPDEIMQYLEPAHYAAFGSGVLYWEYVHGARSWLVPGAVAGVLLALDALGLGRPGVYVAAVKLGFCLLSLLLPWAMYRFTQRAAGAGTAGENAARLALVFGCFWYELVVMAHKPFTEFIGTALLLTALSVLVGADAGRRRVLFAAGALLALGALVRMQYAPLAILLLVLRSLSLRRAQLAALWGGAGALAALVGVLEWQTWGAPFHSYLTNIMVNFGLNRAGESSRWQLPAQLLLAGGGAPAIAFTFGAKLRGPARLLLLLSAAVFLLHLFPAHREYRFIFLLTPCWLMLLAMLSARFDATAAMRRVGAAALLAFGALALANIFPWQSWIHIGHSKENPVHYLRKQDPMFTVMRHLAARDDVRGVFYFAGQTPYFRTGGYYYLHHAVPFYSAHTWGEARRHRPGAGAQEFVSHIVTEDDMRAENMPAFSETFRAGNLVVWRRNADAPLAQWRAHVVKQTDAHMNRLVGGAAAQLRGTPLAPFLAERHWPQAPAAVEFADEAAE
ncbi:MAG: hypothetical protein OD918_03290 [Gammaproteobacteria bacterium]